MGDKETFVNELDRLLLPYIMWLDESGNMEDDPEDPSDNNGGRLMRKFGNLAVSVGWGEVPHPGLVYVSRTDVPSGNVLYERYNGRTETFHPGEWVFTLISQIIDMQAEEELAHVRRALDETLRKARNFMPVEA